MDRYTTPLNNIVLLLSFAVYSYFNANASFFSDINFIHPVVLRWSCRPLVWWRAAYHVEMSISVIGVLCDGRDIVHGPRSPPLHHHKIRMGYLSDVIYLTASVKLAKLGFRL